MPTKLKDFNVDKDKIDYLADLCTFNKTRTIKSYIDLGFKEIKEIFKLSY